MRWLLSLAALAAAALFVSPPPPPAGAQQRMFGTDGRRIEMVYLGCPDGNVLDACTETRPLNVRAQMVGLDGKPLTVQGSVAVSSMPSVTVGAMPALSLAPGQSLGVSSLPPVSLATGQSVAIQGTAAVAIQGTPTVAVGSMPAVALAAGQTVGVAGSVASTQAGQWTLAPYTATPVAAATTSLGTSAVAVLAARAARRYLTIQNQSASDPIWCNLGGAAAVAGPPSLRIAPGGALNHGLTPGFVSGAAVSCISGAASVPVSIWEG